MTAQKVPRIASSLLLLRPRLLAGKVGAGREDYEVLMVQRSDKRGAFRGTVVFPGGVVEASDRASRWAPFLGLADWNLRRQLKLGAIRELLEETGILLSEGNLHEESIRKQRARVNEDSEAFFDVCQEFGVKPDLESLTLIQNWITPLHVPTRFDTFFFLAIAQSFGGAQVAEADGLETVKVGWHSPSRWLELYEQQEVSLLPPQYYQLATLAGAPSLCSVKALCQAVDEDAVLPWMPVKLDASNGVGMCYPGDAAYPADLQLQNACSTKDPLARHRLHMHPVPRKEGGVSGKGMVSAVGGTVNYELERNVAVLFGPDSWGGRRSGDVPGAPKL